MPGQETVTFAQLTDVHLPPMPRFSLRYWNVKRILGYLNWQRVRKMIHCRVTLDRLVEDLEQHALDHVVVTGDLVNIALPEEYRNAKTWIDQLGAADKVTVIPGNHDIYVDMDFSEGVGLWQAHMRSNTDSDSCQGNSVPAEFLPSDALKFPFVRCVGRVAFIGTNSAVPTAPFVASGTLGQQQLSRLEELLHQLGKRGFVRIVLIHHPPLPGQAPPRCALSDASQLQEVLQKAGAELVLHGHNHQDMMVAAKGPVSQGNGNEAEIPIIGLASASANKKRHGRDLARYNLFQVTTEDKNATIRLTRRGLREVDGPIVEIESREFSFRL